MAATDHIGRFALGRRLGEGGMGVVWEAFDEHRRRVALKALRSLDPHSLYLFKTEFRELADLHHPNLVELGELVHADGQWFFTMELVDGVDLLHWVWREAVAASPRVDGPSLAQTLAPGASPTPPPAWPDSSSAGISTQLARPPLDVSRIRDAFAQLAGALDALHRAGKIHRDIKPSNVLVDAAGRVVLLDFGLIAAVTGRDAALAGDAVVGTPAYMAPEQAASQPVTPAADWYGVGVVLYEALTGRLPFAGSPLRVMIEKQQDLPPPPRAIADDVPADLDALVMSLLAIAPAARPRADEVIARLRGATPDATPAPAPARLTSSPLAPFVGRDAELDELRAAADAARTTGAAVLVEGESGVGKSALVRAFVEALVADHPDALVLWGRCYERESVPYQAFDRVVDGLSQALVRLRDDALPTRHAAAMTRLFPVLRRVAALGGADAVALRASPRAQRADAFVGLRELLARLARTMPVVLVLDDLQWADGDSWALLAELVRAPAPPILVVATGRELRDAGGDVDVALRRFRRLRLGALEPADARRLIELIGPGVSRADADTLLDETGGHPMFLQEMARSGDAGAGGLDDVLRRRADAVSAAARGVLRLLASAGGPITLEVIATAAELEVPEASRALAELRAARLARGAGTRARDLAETYHDRVRHAVTTGMAPRERRAAHAALARALEAGGEVDPRVLVAHLEAAGDAGRAALHAERGARAATDALAFEQAAALWGAAVRLGTWSADERRRLERARADALANAGRGPEAADAYLAAAEGAETAERLDARRRAAEHLLGSGHVARGFEVVEMVLGELGEHLPATPRRALLSLMRQRLALRIRGLGWKPRDAADIPPRDLVRLDAYKAVSVCLGPIDLIRGADFQARFLRAALKTGERARIARALALETIYASTMGHKHAARAHDVLARSRAIADAMNDRYLQSYAMTAAAFIAHHGGRFDESAERFADAEALARETNDATPWELDSVRIFRLVSLRVLGRFAQIRDDFDEYVRDARYRGDRFSEGTLVRGVGQVWLADDTPDHLLEALAEAAWEPIEGSYHTQTFFELIVRGEHALYVGNADARRTMAPEIAALERSFLIKVENVGVQMAFLHARFAVLAAARAPVAERAALAAEIAGRAGHLDASGLPYARVWARIAHAGAASVRGDLDAARAHLVEGAEAGERLPMIAACARRQLGALIGATAGDELIAAADAALHELGIRNPERMADAYAPLAGTR